MTARTALSNFLILLIHTTLAVLSPTAACGLLKSVGMISAGKVVIEEGESLLLNCTLPSSAVECFNLTDIRCQLSGSRFEVVESTSFVRSAKGDLQLWLKIEAHNQSGGFYCSIRKEKRNNSSRCYNSSFDIHGHVSVYRRPLKPVISGCEVRNWTGVLCSWGPTLEMQLEHGYLKNRRLFYQSIDLQSHEKSSQWHRMCTGAGIESCEWRIKDGCHSNGQSCITSPSGGNVCVRVTAWKKAFLKKSVISDTYCFKVKDRVVLNPPTNVSVEVTSSDASLKWISPFVHSDYKEPLIYRIRYNSEWRDESGWMEVISNSSVVMLHALHPNTLYSLRIQTSTSTGQLWSEGLAAIFHTSPSVPCSQPKVSSTGFHVRSSNQTHRNVTLYWKATPTRDECGPGLYYEILANSPSGERLSYEVKNVTSLDVVLSNTELTVQVFARNALGVASQSPQSFAIPTWEPRLNREETLQVTVVGNRSTVTVQCNNGSTCLQMVVIYWCQRHPEDDYLCQDEIQWSDQPLTHGQFDLQLAGSFDSYLIGLASNSDSGIHWLKCGYDLEKGKLSNASMQEEPIGLKENSIYEVLKCESEKQLVTTNSVKQALNPGAIFGLVVGCIVFSVAGLIALLVIASKFRFGPCLTKPGIIITPFDMGPTCGKILRSDRPLYYPQDRFISDNEKVVDSGYATVVDKWNLRPPFQGSETDTVIRIIESENDSENKKDQNISEEFEDQPIDRVYRNGMHGLWMIPPFNGMRKHHSSSGISIPATIKDTHPQETSTARLDSYCAGHASVRNFFEPSPDEEPCALLVSNYECKQMQSGAESEDSQRLLSEDSKNDAEQAPFLSDSSRQIPKFPPRSELHLRENQSQCESLRTDEDWLLKLQFSKEPRSMLPALPYEARRVRPSTSISFGFEQLCDTDKKDSDGSKHCISTRNEAKPMKINNSEDCSFKLTSIQSTGILPNIIDNTTCNSRPTAVQTGTITSASPMMSSLTSSANVMESLPRTTKLMHNPESSVQKAETLRSLPKAENHDSNTDMIQTGCGCSISLETHGSILPSCRQFETTTRDTEDAKAVPQNWENSNSISDDLHTSGQIISLCSPTNKANTMPQNLGNFICTSDDEYTLGQVSDLSKQTNKAKTVPQNHPSSTFTSDDEYASGQVIEFSNPINNTKTQNSHSTQTRPTDDGYTTGQVIDCLSQANKANSASQNDPNSSFTSYDVYTTGQVIECLSQANKANSAPQNDPNSSISSYDGYTTGQVIHSGGYTSKEETVPENHPDLTSTSDDGYTSGQVIQF